MIIFSVIVYKFLRLRYFFYFNFCPFILFQWHLIFGSSSYKNLTYPLPLNTKINGNLLVVIQPGTFDSNCFCVPFCEFAFSYFCQWHSREGLCLWKIPNCSKLCNSTLQKQIFRLCSERLRNMLAAFVNNDINKI